MATKMEVKSTGNTPQSEVNLFKDAQRIMKEKLVSASLMGGTMFSMWDCDGSGNGTVRAGMGVEVGL